MLQILLGQSRYIKMVSLRLLFLTTNLFISQVHSQLTLAPRPCGPTTITPTGPIIPIGQCIVPAIIKPLITPYQPLFPPQPLLPCPPSSPFQPLLPCPPSPPCQPLPPLLPYPPSPPCQPLPPLQPLPICPPMPPGPPPQPCIPKKPAPCVEDDDDEDLDKILYLLINNILENRKNSGKKSGSGKGTDSDNGMDSSSIYLDIGDDYEFILPSPYQPPESATFYPHGTASAYAASSSSADASFTLPASDNGYAPEICLTFRPFIENTL